MKSFRKNRFFLPIAMLVAVVGTIVCLSANSQQASAASSCVTQSSTRTVTLSGYTVGTYKYYQTLRQNNSGSCVKTLQSMANVLCTSGTRLAVDGSFGPLTYKAIRSIQYAYANHPNFQIRVNGSPIIVDGVAGPQTWSILQAFAFWGSPTNGGPINCRP